MVVELSKCLRSWIIPNSGWPDDERFIRGVGPFVEHFSQVDKRKRSEHLQAQQVGHYRKQQRKQVSARLSKESVARMQTRANGDSALLWKTYPLTQEFALLTKRCASRWRTQLDKPSRTCLTSAVVQADQNLTLSTPSIARKNSRDTTCWSRGVRSLAWCNYAPEPAFDLPGRQGETRARRYLLPRSS